MDKKYYLRQCRLALLYAAICLIGWHWGQHHSTNANLLHTSLVCVSALLFPYTTKLFERLAHLTRAHKVFSKLFGTLTPRNDGFIMLYHFGCFAFSLPLGGVYLILTLMGRWIGRASASESEHRSK